MSWHFATQLEHTTQCLYGLDLYPTADSSYNRAPRNVDPQNVLQSQSQGNREGWVGKQLLAQIPDVNQDGSNSQLASGIAD